MGEGAMCNCSLRKWRQGLPGAGWLARLALPVSSRLNWKILLHDRTKEESNPERSQASTAAFTCTHENMPVNTLTKKEKETKKRSLCA